MCCLFGVVLYYGRERHARTYTFSQATKSMTQTQTQTLTQTLTLGHSVTEKLLVPEELRTGCMVCDPQKRAAVMYSLLIYKNLMNDAAKT